MRSAQTHTETGSGARYPDVPTWTPVLVACLQSLLIVLLVLLPRAANLLLTAVRMRRTPTTPTSLVLNLRQLMNPDVCRMTFTFVFMLTFNHVFWYFLKVPRLPTVVCAAVLSTTLLGRPMSARTLLSCLCVDCGFILSLDQGMAFNHYSLMAQLCGGITSFGIALFGIFTKKALLLSGHSSRHLAFLCNLNACVILSLILSLNDNFSPSQFSCVFRDVYVFVFTAPFAFGLTWLNICVIDRTCPVMRLVITQTLLTLLQGGVKVVYHNQHKPPFWWFSVFMVVGGAVSYIVPRPKTDL